MNDRANGALLELREITKEFGGLVAVNRVSFDIPPGQIKALIGPNGAGKTTAFNLICGLDLVTHGSIAFAGKEISSLAPHEVARAGISRTFQTVRLFGQLSVLENVMVGRYLRTRAGVLASGMMLPWARQEERAVRESAHHWLQFVGLEERAQEVARNLPYGRQRLLEIGRALATEPRLLLLDEPAAGLNDAETEALGEVIRRIRELGITVLLVEHDMGLVMDISDSVVVLDHGVKIAEGTPDEVGRDPVVIAAYLGGEAVDA